MRNILHLIETSGPGGAEKVLINLVEDLDRKGYSSIVGLLKDGWLNTQLRAMGFQTVVIPQGPGLDINWIRQTVHLMKAHGINVIHAHEYTMSAYGSLLSIIRPTPLIATVHGKNAFYAESVKRRIGYRFVSRQATRMVAVSKDIKNFLKKRVGIRCERIGTIHNGISVRKVPETQIEQLRSELSIKRGSPVIGTVGSLYPVKGHTYLLKAAQNVTQLFPDATFLISGRGGLLEALEEEIKGLKITENVRLLGFREDVPALLQLLDIFVLPSLSEGISIALLEAMAAGKPTIATMVGGNPEVVVENETGFLVPAADVRSLTEKITVLLREKDRARRMGDMGRQRVERHFSLETMVQKYQQLYECCLAR